MTNFIIQVIIAVLIILLVLFCSFAIPYMAGNGWTAGKINALTRKIKERKNG